MTNVPEIITFVSKREENNMGKKRNPSYLAFSPFPTMYFQSNTFLIVVDESFKQIIHKHSCSIFEKIFQTKLRT